MKIEKTTSSLPAAKSSEGQARASSARQTGGASTASSSGTSVHLGATSSQLLSMEASMASSSIVDAAKVAEIKQAISENRFRVDASVVADKLIETVKDLVRTHKA